MLYVLTIMMFTNAEPHLQYKQIPMPSMEECFKAAQKFTTMDISTNDDIIGIGAGCQEQKNAEEKKS